MDRNRSASEALVTQAYAQKKEDDVKVQFSDLPTPRPDYKSDKTCVGCGQTFGLMLNIVHSKRYCCCFCYRGICAKCSPYTLQHPETQQPERCCNACYNRLVTQDIRSKMQDELNEQRSKVKELIRKIDEERQAEMRETFEIEELTKKLREMEEDAESQRLRNEQTVQQLTQEERKLQQHVADLRERLREQQDREERVREQTLRNTNDAALLRHQQEVDQQKAAELLARKAALDADLATVRKQLQDPVVFVAEESAEKNKRVAELQQGLALERELLVKLQQENIALTQQVKNPDKPNRSSLKEQELSAVPHEAQDLRERVAKLKSENECLQAELEELRNVTPGEDSELDRLKAAVAKEKEENTKLMLLFQDRLLNHSAADSLTRDKCHCCVS